MTGEEAKEAMERAGYECVLLDGCVPMVKHPDTRQMRSALIVYAGLLGLACHVYEQGVILVPREAKFSLADFQ